jgi:hypothetical protein
MIQYPVPPPHLQAIDGVAVAFSGLLNFSSLPIRKELKTTPNLAERKKGPPSTMTSPLSKPYG